MWRCGPRTDAAGREWQRFLCRPVAGRPHKFRLLIEDEPTEVVISPPPPCPDTSHRGSGVHVIRNGGYGRRVRRQQYECRFEDAAGDVHLHWFVADLPRDQVGERRTSCRECEVLVGVHRGEPASSRRSSWPLNAVVEALSELSLGTSYAQASTNLWDRAELARAHLASHQDGEESSVAPARQAPAGGDREPERASESYGSTRGRSAWHLAADLVEQYSPVLYEEAIAPVREAELAMRARNDEILAAGGTPDQPVTFVVDEIPVYIRLGDAQARVAWTVLTVAEVTYRPGRKPGHPVQRDTRLRLARAMPGPANATTWFLVLDELGLAPDVLVSDFGKAAHKAADVVYADRDVLWVPSLYHFASNITDMLMDKQGYHVGTGKGRRPVPEFDAHVRLVTRDWLVAGGVAGWAAWWDDFQAMAKAAKAPANPLKNVRDLYEGPIAAAIAPLTNQPFLPASNAGIEIKNRNLLKPLLRGRSQRYRNLARTNALLDLVVAREHGLFLDRGRVARLIRSDNTAAGNGGWATPMRTFDDPQPPVITDTGPVVDELDAIFLTDPPPADEVVPVVGAGPGNVTRKTRPPRPAYSSLLDPGLVTSLYLNRLEGTP